MLLFLVNLSYADCTLSKERIPKHYKTLDTIGDSITWAHDGEKLRCMLDEQNIGYDFSGYYLDKYGYRHDGHGGDTTIDVLNRVGTIPKADIYSILLGVNDNRFKSPIKTYVNLMKIASKLYEKNKKAIIYISTLLPITKESNKFNDEVNSLLRNGLNCQNCKLIDLGYYFESQPNWEKLLVDGVHPNLDGYKVIVEYLKEYLNGEGTTPIPETSNTRDLASTD